jgi:rhodanese-related sulfurtransferase
MQKRYIFLALIFIVIAAGLLFIPSMKEKTQIPASAFLKDIHSNNRYISTDQLAKRIINGDPTLFLVDVRSEEEYKVYSLPEAVNMPLSNLLKEDWQGYLDQEVLDVIFFSNDDILAEQAWALCRQQGYTNLYVLAGGLNEWFGTIMLPEKPSELASSEELELYSFRTGASIYFGSGTVPVPVVVEKEEKPKPEPKKTIPKKKKVKVEAEGGC